MFETVGVWIFGQTLTQRARGPWDRGNGAPVSVAESWRNCIDYLADKGVNAVITNLSGVWHGGWVFHQYLDFPDFPEARILDPETVHQSRDHVNQILAHARGRGVGIFLHHYNFCAPGSLLLAHPELRTHDIRGFEERGLDQAISALEKGTAYGNLCWSNEVYQRFMAKVYEESFQLFPDLAGFCATIGEPAYCSCETCSDRRAMTSTYAQVFIDAHRQAGRRPLIRTWWIWTYFDTMPKGATYIVKADECDAVNVPPDPKVFWWMEHGHDVWVTKAIGPSENSPFILWANPRFVWESLKACEEAGIKGVIGWVTDHVTL